MNSIAEINPSIAESVEQAEAIRTSMQMKLDEMRRAYHKAPYPSCDERKHDLKQLKRLIGENTDAISKAISLDYGHRSAHAPQCTFFDDGDAVHARIPQRRES